MSFLRPKKRDYERMTLAEATTLLTGKASNKLFVDIETHGDGYVLDQKLLGLVQDQTNTIDQDTTAAPYIRYTETATGNTPIAITISETLIELLVIHIDGAMNATVAARTINFKIDPLPISSSLVFPFVNPAQLALSANQEGNLYMTAGSVNHYEDDNGTTTIVANESILPMILYAGTVITTVLSNFEATDVHGVELIYKVLQR